MPELEEPIRLFRTRGQWTLELTRLVAVDPHILRPERRRMTGADNVLRHLKERLAPGLAREALELIVGEDDGRDRAFTLEGERWIEAERLTSQADERTSALRATIKELQCDVMTLRALHETLRSRIAQLEHRLVNPVPAPMRGATQREAPAASLRHAARVRSVPPPVVNTVASPLVSPTAVSGAQLDPPAMVAATAPTEAVAAPEPSPATTPADASAAFAVKESADRRKLRVPKLSDVANCLRQLLGTDPALSLARGQPPLSLKPYVSRVVDANDQEVGAVLIDAKAGAELGGRLLGLPAASAAEQAKTALSSDLLDAVNEVVNNLGGFINRANPEVRVKVRPLEVYDEQAHAWLATCSGSSGCITNGGGQVWILVR